VDLRDMTPEDWQRKIGVIFQDFVRYDLTARDNIGFGEIDGYLRGDLNGRLEQAAAQGGANEVVAELSKGYDTVLGRRFEDGTDLSGGQWQKIALARAFVRDADLLVLDEPTAALDAFAEAAVYTQFAELTKGKTTVFVTHRLFSIKMAEQIVVLKDGALIEQGNHAALMALKGEYAQMYSLQADRYA
jgi:ATP-binding cassette subfamily B protein